MKAVPPLPSSVYSPLGPIPVDVVPDLKSKDGEECMGLWLPDARAIRVCAGMAPIPAYHTLLHEKVHAILWDAGVQLTEKQNEAVADAIATALLAELLHAE